jgi:U32 family peptidase
LECEVVIFKPELLAPAGSLEKLKVAVMYGADAVFLAGLFFGLRKYTDNFSNDELAEGVDFAHHRGVKVYVVLNEYPLDSDMAKLDEVLHTLDRLKVDGLIISDLGMFSRAKSETSLPLHVSTQANVCNWSEALVWRELGASRVILAREVALSDCQEIMAKASVEVEIFIHGSMCASYSGRCVISNYTAGRDSNRGGCVQSCRYGFKGDDDQRDAHYLMNAKDLMGVRQIGPVMQLGIASLKIEGRMKSVMYLANAVSVYRQLIDQLYGIMVGGSADGFSQFDYSPFEERLALVSNRDFSSGFLKGEGSQGDVNLAWDGYQSSVSFVGSIVSIKNNVILVDVKGAFNGDSDVWVILLDGERLSLDMSVMSRLDGTLITRANPNMLVYIDLRSMMRYVQLLSDNLILYVFD